MSSKSNSGSSHNGKTEERVNPRSQKEILGLIRKRNKKNKGPYLRRPDQITAKIVNVSKSYGFKVQMSNLPGIDYMLTNFN